MEAIEKFIAVIGRENISIVLTYFLLKKLINGLIPCIESYIRAKARALDKVSGEERRVVGNKRIDDSGMYD